MTKRKSLRDKLTTEFIFGDEAEPAERVDSPPESFMLLDEIKLREADTRNLRQEHVEALAESIAVLGLLEPLVVDRNGRLLAGAHRLAAIHLIQESKPDKFAEHFGIGQIPIRKLDFDATQEPEKAFQVEVAENEHRRDYTTDEVRAIAERLKTAGYSELKGRPKAGQKALKPALAVIIGKSSRQVQRYLNPNTGNQNGKGGQDVHLSEAKILKRLNKDLRELEQLNQSNPTKKRGRVTKALEQLIKAIES